MEELKIRNKLIEYFGDIAESDILKILNYIEEKNLKSIEEVEKILCELAEFRKSITIDDSEFDEEE